LVLWNKNKIFAANEIEYQYLLAEKISKVLKWKLHYILDEGMTRKKAWYRGFFVPSDTGWGSR
jgi:hypothetical protein